MTLDTNICNSTDPKLRLLLFKSLIKCPRIISCYGTTFNMRQTKSRDFTYLLHGRWMASCTDWCPVIGRFVWIVGCLNASTETVQCSLCSLYWCRIVVADLRSSFLTSFVHVAPSSVDVVRWIISTLICDLIVLNICKEGRYNGEWKRKEACKFRVYISYIRRLINEIQSDFRKLIFE